MKEINKKPSINEEKFIDEEDDKRVIVFITIAIVIIIAIIIGLLVGCTKNEEEKVPDAIEDDTPQEVIKKDEVVEETTTIEEVKTTVVKTSNKKEEVNEPTNDYLVTFYYNDNLGVEKIKVNEGNNVPSFVPEGYDSCEYYDLNGNQINLNNGVYENKTIQMECSTNTYTIIYDKDGIESQTYRVTDGILDLPVITTNKIFIGWFLTLNNGEYSNLINKITPSIIEYADSDNNIYLYAKEVDDIKVNYYDEDGVLYSSVTLDNPEENLAVIDGINNNNLACTSENNFLGWSVNNDNTIDIKFGSTISVSDSVNLYAVCGTATVAYASEVNGITEIVKEVGIKDEDKDDYVVPETPAEAGIETPTYFVEVVEPTETSKTVVEDSKPDEDMASNEIRLSEVVDKAAQGYTPEVNDEVEKLEKVFDGWIIDTDNDITTTTDQEEVPETIVPLEDETTLVAEWSEQAEETPPLEMPEA